ncbi:MAG: coenzyme F420-0:L-glutamate ligase [Elusimicrobiaceae bacterium]|nr:coenzyme F420-0:L-glutamate ligase [Elusimicrobiaceae bacterium]
MNVTPVHTELFKEGADLPAFILRFAPNVEENTVLAVSSKVVALWKNNTVPYESWVQKERLIKQHSQAALKTPLAWLTIKDGMIMTNAGIDESNAKGKLILLPDCYAAADELRTKLKQKWHVQNLGIVITDSMILPLRAGVVAAAVGYAGFKGVTDLRGKPDLFGRPLQTTLVDVADSLATSAALVMGEADERCPLCMIENAPVYFTEKTDRNEIKYPVQNDLYTPLLQATKLITKEK